MGNGLLADVVLLPVYISSKSLLLPPCKNEFLFIKELLIFLSISRVARRYPLQSILVSPPGQHPVFFCIENINIPVIIVHGLIFVHTEKVSPFLLKNYFFSLS